MLHAPQSGEAGVGRVSRVMALEQLPVVCFGEGRSGADQRMGHFEDEDAESGGVEPTVSAVVVPMSRKARDMGHPRLDGAIGRQHANGRPGPPAHYQAQWEWCTQRSLKVGHPPHR